MFERFTDRARKVMTLVEKSCRDYGHKLGCQIHLLWGLLEEGSGIAATVLKEQLVKLPPDRFHEVLKEHYEPAMPANVAPKGFLRTQELSVVLHEAIEESYSFGHSHTGTEHLLLSLMRAPTVEVMVLLNEAGTTAQTVINATRRLLGNIGIKAVATVMESEPNEDLRQAVTTLGTMKFLTVAVLWRQKLLTEDERLVVEGLFNLKKEEQIVGP